MSRKPANRRISMYVRSRKQFALQGVESSVQQSMPESSWPTETFDALLCSLKTIARLAGQIFPSGLLIRRKNLISI
ncbi:hypothetical protein ABIE63_000149 [Limibacillus sp. MBR-115]|jgi:hypothetical protein